LNEKYRICSAGREPSGLQLDCQDTFGPSQPLATCTSTIVLHIRSLGWMLGLSDMVRPFQGSLYLLEPRLV